MKILLADDDLVSRFVLQRAVEKLGHECLVAGDGETAWQIVRDQSPEVLVTDWMMPGASGPELCRRIRKLHLPHYTYIVLLSSLTEPADHLAGMQAGADNYMTKPLDLFALASMFIAAERVTSLHTRLDRLARQAPDAEEPPSPQVTRELCTPLNVISGVVSLLSDGTGGQLTETQTQYVDILRHNTELLRRMVDDLISTNPSPTGNLAVQVAPGALEPLIMGVVAGLATAAVATSVHLVVQLEDLPLVSVDGQRLHQVLTDLLENALRSTPPGGQVTVSASTDTGEADTVVVSVADTGLGMTEEEVEHAFDRLPQGTRAPEAGPDGLAPGLYPCRQIVEQHGGQIWVDSQAGAGSTYHFTLRVAPDLSPAATVWPAV